MMNEYKYIIVGNAHEIQTIEKAINAHLSRYYRATPKRIDSNFSSVTFSVSLSLFWAESFERILKVALYNGLKNTDIFYSESWLVDTL